MTESKPAKAVRVPSAQSTAQQVRGCDRILVIGRTGSGKTTLANALAEALRVPHVELDALHFLPGFATVPLAELRTRTAAAVAGDKWVADGNKAAVRDLVWPRTDLIVWLDYPLVVSLWRLGRRALRRTTVLKQERDSEPDGRGLARQYAAGAKAVARALRSHRGQRRTYPRLFAEPQHQDRVVVRLRSPRATRRWLQQVTGPELP